MKTGLKFFDYMLLLFLPSFSCCNVIVAALVGGSYYCCCFCCCCCMVVVVVGIIGVFVNTCVSHNRIYNWRFFSENTRTFVYFVYFVSGDQENLKFLADT